MKNVFFLVFFVLSGKALAQLDTCLFVSDTLMKINSCSIGAGPCPTEEISIDTSLVHYLTGLKTYLIPYDPANPGGCIYEYQLGSFNYGDTIPVTFAKNDFQFYNSTCSISFCKFALVAIGKPKIVGENYYCVSDIQRVSGFTVDGCANYCTEDIYVTGGKNCTTNTCSVSNVFDANADFFSPSIKIFPNPARETVTVIGQRGATIELSDAPGSVTLSEKINSNHFIFDLQNLDSGIYFIKIVKGTYRFTHKLVIQK